MSYVQQCLNASATLQDKQLARIFIDKLLKFCETQASLSTQDLDLATRVIMHGEANLRQFRSCKNTLESQVIKQRLASIDSTDLQKICRSFGRHTGFCDMSGVNVHFYRIATLILVQCFITVAGKSYGQHWPDPVTHSLGKSLCRELLL
jgi:hypothetical protein